MLIEQPPILYRLLFSKSFWRIKVPHQKTVYLTFDDGPIPEVTPWVLNVLDHYKVKATFFCVGDNVRKHPDVYQQLLEGGIKPVITPSTIYRYGTTKHPSCWTILQKQMH